MYYYTCPIPRHPPTKEHPEGMIAQYPPHWFGEMAQCPKNVTVLIFNDREGWLLAQVDDTFVPKEVKVLSKDEATKLMSITQQDPDVFVGVQAITARWAKQDAEQAAAQKIRLKEAFDMAVGKVLNDK